MLKNTNTNFNYLQKILSNFKRIRYTFVFVLTFVLSFFTFNIQNLKSQGFDWYYSSRLPFDIPKLFVGAKAEIGSLNHNVNLSLLEAISGNELGNEFECCRFNFGAGRSIKIGGIVEYWYESYSAVNLSFGFVQNQVNFERNTTPLPLPNGDFFNTKITYNTNISNLYFDLGWRYKILESHFFINPSLNVNYYLSSSAGDMKESIVSPDYETFSDGSLVRIIENGKVPETNSINYNFNFKIGYDFSIDNGIYISPYLGYMLSLNNLVSNQVSNSGINSNANEKWFQNGFFLGANFLYGL